MRIERVEDIRDPRVDDYRDLPDSGRRAAEVFIAESALVVRRLLTVSRFSARSILATPAALDGLRDAIDRAPVELVVHVAAPAILRDIVGFKFHRGCVAIGEHGAALAPEALLSPPGPRTLLVLENVADPDNVGALFRDAWAFGVGGVLLAPGTADPLYRKALRVSVGAGLVVPFARLTRWPDELAEVRAAGYAVVALAADGAVEITEIANATGGSGPGRLALLVGGEGQGLSAAARALADISVRIAMAPGVDSLNVAVAAGIALHHVTRPPARAPSRGSSPTPSRRAAGVSPSGRSTAGSRRRRARGSG